MVLKDMWLCLGSNSRGLNSYLEALHLVLGVKVIAEGCLDNRH
jgi:hypothetical protein